MKIIITEKDGIFHARFDNRSTWATGASREEAIGLLLVRGGAQTGITLESRLWRDANR